MDIEVSIKLRHDSYNSYPGKIKMETYGEDQVMFTLGDRIFTVEASDLRKAVMLVTDD